MRYKRQCLDCGKTWWIPGLFPAFDCPACKSTAIVTVAAEPAPGGVT